MYKEVGKSDFAGGYHGDEILTNISFYGSGQLISTLEDISLTPCSDFHYIENSTMHEAPAIGNTPNMAHPEQARHIKITTFSTEGFYCKNIVTWSKEITLTHYYSGIYCVGRNVSKTAYTDKDFISRDLDSYDNSLLGGSGLRLYNTQNPTSKFSFSITSSILQGGSKLVDNLQVLEIRDNGLPSQYKKYYRGIPFNVTTVLGESWVSEMKAIFKYTP